MLGWFRSLAKKVTDALNAGRAHVKKSSTHLTSRAEALPLNLLPPTSGHSSNELEAKEEKDTAEAQRPSDVPGPRVHDLPLSLCSTYVHPVMLLKALY